MGIGVLSLVFLLSVFGSEVGGHKRSEALQRLRNSPKLSYQWRKLLQYKSPWLRDQQSIVVRKNFFLHESGATDPEAEFLETLSQMSRTDLRPNQSPQCHFPARAEFLQRFFGVSLGASVCPQLKYFISAIEADRASLVFSSQYTSNPSSLMGHTFLRLHATKNQSRSQHHAILDPTIGYAAAVPDGVGMLHYILGGLFGGFPGIFEIVPYHHKIKNYGSEENRDLWEYELNLNPDEVHFLTLHLWELFFQSRFHYYFTDENCSFMLMTLIDAVHPDWKLSERFPLWVLPHETLKAAQRAGALQPAHYRPSLQRTIHQTAQSLDSEEKTWVQQTIKSEKNTGPFPSPQAALLISEWVEYQKFKNEGKIQDSLSLLQAKSLVAQSHSPSSKLPVHSLSENPPSSPLLSHHLLSAGFALGVANSPGQTFVELNLRPALHTFMDPSAGFVPNTEIDLLHLKLQVQNLTSGYPSGKPHFRVERLGLFEMRNLRDYSWIDPVLSWHFSTALLHPRDYGCSSCWVGHVSHKVGWGHSFHSSLYAYFLAGGYAEAGEIPQSSVRGGPSLSSGVTFEPDWNLPFKLHTGIEANLDLFQSRRAIGFGKVFSEAALTLSPICTLFFEYNRTQNGFATPGSHLFDELKLGSQFYF